MADHTALPSQLVTYWTKGKGAAEIAWGSPGDFDRCRVAVNAKISEHGGKPLPGPEISGLCSNLHRIATGRNPGDA